MTVYIVSSMGLVLILFDLKSSFDLSNMVHDNLRIIVTWSMTNKSPLLGTDSTLLGTLLWDISILGAIVFRPGRTGFVVGLATIG